MVQVMEQVQNQEPPGRFLTNESSDNAVRENVFKKISYEMLSQRGEPRRGESSDKSGNGGSKTPKRATKESSLIAIPRDNDILLGRGIGPARHPGNVKFREFCRDAREFFNRASSPYVKVGGVVLLRVLAATNVLTLLLAARSNDDWC
jgi:hypothetical protein